MERDETRLRRTERIGLLAAAVVERLKDCVTDQLGDLGDDGVSEGSNSGHDQFAGNPMFHSYIRGNEDGSKSATVNNFAKVRWWPRSKFVRTCCKVMMKRMSCFIGEGDNPDAIPSDCAANSGSRYAMPFRTEPDLGQVAKNSAKPSPRLSTRASKQVCDVLHDEEGRSYFANQSDNFRPESAPGSFRNPSLTSRCANVLAREPAADDIDGNSIGSKSFAGKLAHVAVAGDIGPVLGEDAAGEVFDFAEGNGFKAASPFQSEGKSTDAAEQVQHLELRRQSAAERIRVVGRGGSAAGIGDQTAEGRG